MTFKVAIALGTILATIAVPHRAEAADPCTWVALDHFSGRIVKIERPKSPPKTSYLYLKTDSPYCGVFYGYNSYDSNVKLTSDLYASVLSKINTVSMRVGDRVDIVGHFEKRSSGFGFDHWAWDEFSTTKVTVRK